jgi:hypothetical protein
MKNLFTELGLVIVLAVSFVVALEVSAQQNIIPISHYPVTNTFSPTDRILISIPGVTNKSIVASNLFGAALAVSSYGGFTVTTNIGNQLVVTMTNGVATNLTVLGTLTSTNNDSKIQSATNNFLPTVTNAANASALAATNGFLSVATNIANAQALIATNSLGIKVAQMQITNTASVSIGKFGLTAFPAIVGNSLTNTSGQRVLFVLSFWRTNAYSLTITNATTAMSLTWSANNISTNQEVAQMLLSTNDIINLVTSGGFTFTSDYCYLIKQ